jgi:hypothetical protein
MCRSWWCVIGVRRAREPQAGMTWGSLRCWLGPEVGARQRQAVREDDTRCAQTFANSSPFARRPPSRRRAQAERRVGRYSRCSLSWTRVILRVWRVWPLRIDGPSSETSRADPSLRSRVGGCGSCRSCGRANGRAPTSSLDAGQRTPASTATTARTSIRRSTADGHGPTKSDRLVESSLRSCS